VWLYIVGIDLIDHVDGSPVKFLPWLSTPLYACRKSLYPMGP
jgi:hypothetical protein